MGVRKVTLSAYILPYDAMHCHADCMDTIPNISSHLHAREGSLLQRLISPLNIAAYVTWIAVCLSVIDLHRLRAADPGEWAGLAALLAILGLFIGCAGRSTHSDPAWLPSNVIAQGVLVVVAEWLLRGGQTVILLIVVASQMVLLMPTGRFLALMLAFNAGIAAVWLSHEGSFTAILLSLLPVLGFQAFAALTGHFAGNSERAREHLAQVNAELLATRRLLEESARAGERLKLSRELHDVAGHSLTALKLNLARLARDPALAEREELQISSTLADDLLAQIRQVVSTLRAHDGFDLRAALEALAHPLPGVRVSLDIEDDLRVDDIDQAETLLRSAQEAITNAIRHGRARAIRLGLHRRDGVLELSIENDGIAPSRVEFGNGLRGMRERLDAVGGVLDVTPTRPRGLRVVARIPLLLPAESVA